MEFVCVNVNVKHMYIEYDDVFEDGLGSRLTHDRYSTTTCERL